MTRRQLLQAAIDAARLSLLRLRVQLGQPLPAAAAVLLVELDRWSAALTKEKAPRR